MTSAKWARTAASRVSVLASIPVALANLTGVDDDYGQRRSCQGCQGQFQTTRSLQQDGRDSDHQLEDQFPDPGLVVGDDPSLARRPDADIHLRL